jgi:hypothetical protein
MPKAAAKAPVDKVAPVAKTLVLGGIEFKSRAATKQALRNFINEKLAEGPAPEVHKHDPMFAILCDVLRLSNKKGWYMKGGPEKFLVMPDKSLSVKSAGNKEAINFSYSKLIDNPDTDAEAEKKLTMAMRTTIQPQIERYRDANFKSGFTPCQYYNCDNPTKPLTSCHIDHYGLTFAELKKRFLENVRKQELPSAYQFTMDKDTTSATHKRTKFRESHLALETRWYKYHEEYCKLRVVCEKCNLSNVKIDAKNGHNQTKLALTPVSTTSTAAPKTDGFAPPRTIQQMFNTNQSK